MFTDDSPVQLLIGGGGGGRPERIASASSRWLGFWFLIAKTGRRATMTNSPPPVLFAFRDRPPPTQLTFNLERWRGRLSYCSIVDNLFKHEGGLAVVRRRCLPFGTRTFPFDYVDWRMYVSFPPIYFSLFLFFFLSVSPSHSHPRCKVVSKETEAGGRGKATGIPPFADTESRVFSCLLIIFALCQWLIDK